MSMNAIFPYWRIQWHASPLISDTKFSYCQSTTISKNVKKKGWIISKQVQPLLSYHQHSPVILWENIKIGSNTFIATLLRPQNVDCCLLLAKMYCHWLYGKIKFQNIDVIALTLSVVISMEINRRFYFWNVPCSINTWNSKINLNSQFLPHSSEITCLRGWFHSSKIQKEY